MSNEPTKVGNGPLAGMPLQRYWSGELRWLGFRYGAPIYRATATFTLDDLKNALFNQGELSFTTAVERHTIRMHVTAVRECAITQSLEFLNDVFPDSTPVVSNGCWIVEGLLMEPDNDGGYTFAMAQTFEAGSTERERQEEEDLYLKVLAVVGFDNEGRCVSAIVQRVPSPADQLLYLPPL